MVLAVAAEGSGALLYFYATCPSVPISRRFNVSEYGSAREAQGEATCFMHNGGRFPGASEGGYRHGESWSRAVGRAASSALSRGWWAELRADEVDASRRSRARVGQRLVKTKESTFYWVHDESVSAR